MLRPSDRRRVPRLYRQERPESVPRCDYTEKASIEEVCRGHGPGFFVRQQYHLMHCLFLIKKLHRALASGKTVDGQIKTTHHTEHCIGQLLQSHGFREHDVQLSYAKFPYCGKSGGSLPTAEDLLGEPPLIRALGGANRVAEAAGLAIGSAASKGNLTAITKLLE
ncbi:hypothetical protein CC80DRAFT_507538 [Byssothecium circinans]|uniref:Uncharacterized protein n=1 Tax=Byssothecium circinans TaxID=147558 RepID=A0A6A5TMC1_9PLEO|nr:hypothetical protein CC80DRAFT_507538 [Byssothecium circinans]